MIITERDLIMLMHVNEQSLRIADNGTVFGYPIETRRQLAERLLNAQTQVVETKEPNVKP